MVPVAWGSVLDVRCARVVTGVLAGRVLGLLVRPEPLLVDVAEVTSWREHAERAEERAERAEARIEELPGQFAVLSRMLFGRSSEKTAAGAGEVQEPQGAGGSGGTDGDGDGERPRRWQRPGSRGHGRRDYSHLDSREEINDVPPDQRVCPDCGQEFTALGSEGSEQIDWQVHLRRIVHRRGCACPGPRTVIAPPAANPIPKGRFTAGFCARLLYLKLALGLPVHRIVTMPAAEGLATSEGTLAGVLKALTGLEQCLKPVDDLGGRTLPRMPNQESSKVAGPLCWPPRLPENGDGPVW